MARQTVRGRDRRRSYSPGWPLSARCGLGYAVAGFAVVAAAAVLVIRAGDEVSRLVRPVAVSERTDDDAQGARRRVA